MSEIERKQYSFKARWPSGGVTSEPVAKGGVSLLHALTPATGVVVGALTFQVLESVDADGTENWVTLGDALGVAIGATLVAGFSTQLPLDLGAFDQFRIIGAAQTSGTELVIKGQS